MIEMYVKKVSLESARKIYMTYLKTDFPSEEIKPFAVIEKMWNNDSYYVYAFYEKASEDDTGKSMYDQRDILCAYAFLLADNTKHTLLLDYFAVCKDRRGEGYGSRAIALLREVCATVMCWWWKWKTMNCRISARRYEIRGNAVFPSILRQDAA